MTMKNLAVVDACQYQSIIAGLLKAKYNGKKKPPVELQELISASSDDVKHNVNLWLEYRKNVLEAKIEGYDIDDPLLALVTNETLDRAIIALKNMLADKNLSDQEISTSLKEVLLENPDLDPNLPVRTIDKRTQVEHVTAPIICHFIANGLYGAAVAWLKHRPADLEISTGTLGTPYIQLASIIAALSDTTTNDYQNAKQLLNMMFDYGVRIDTLHKFMLDNHTQEMSILEYAVRCGNLDLASLLVKHGASIELVNINIKPKALFVSTSEDGQVTVKVETLEKTIQLSAEKPDTTTPHHDKPKNIMTESEITHCKQLYDELGQLLPNKHKDLRIALFENGESTSDSAPVAVGLERRFDLREIKVNGFNGSPVSLHEYIQQICAAKEIKIEAFGTRSIPTNLLIKPLIPLLPNSGGESASIMPNISLKSSRSVILSVPITPDLTPLDVEVFCPVGKSEREIPTKDNQAFTVTSIPNTDVANITHTDIKTNDNMRSARLIIVLHRGEVGHYGVHSRSGTAPSKKTQSVYSSMLPGDTSNQSYKTVETVPTKLTFVSSYLLVPPIVIEPAPNNTASSLQTLAVTKANSIGIKLAQRYNKTAISFIFNHVFPVTGIENLNNTEFFEHAILKAAGIESYPDAGFLAKSPAKIGITYTGVKTNAEDFATAFKDKLKQFYGEELWQSYSWQTASISIPLDALYAKNDQIIAAAKTLWAEHGDAYKYQIELKSRTSSYRYNEQEGLKPVETLFQDYKKKLGNTHAEVLGKSDMLLRVVSAIAGLKSSWGGCGVIKHHNRGNKRSRGLEGEEFNILNFFGYLTFTLPDAMNKDTKINLIKSLQVMFPKHAAKISAVERDLNLPYALLKNDTFIELFVIQTKKLAHDCPQAFDEIYSQANGVSREALISKIEALTKSLTDDQFFKNNDAVCTIEKGVKALQVAADDSNATLEQRQTAANQIRAGLRELRNAYRGDDMLSAYLKTQYKNPMNELLCQFRLDKPEQTYLLMRGQSLFENLHKRVAKQQTPGKPEIITPQP